MNATLNFPTTKEEARVAYDPRVIAIKRLRVNVKSLAAEARFIRREEQKSGDFLRYRMELADHRRGSLREEARYAQLALAFIRGRPHRNPDLVGGVAVCGCESPKTHKPVDLFRLTKKIQKFFPCKEPDVTAWILS